MAINVCFSTTSALTSRIIRAVTRSTVSHALLTFRDASLGKIVVLEAVSEGFRVVTWKSWQRHNQLVERYALTLSDDVQAQALSQLAERLGEGYDYLGAVGWLGRLLHFGNPFASRSRLFCSEAVALFLQMCGLDVQEPSLESPESLLERARSGVPFLDISRSRG